MWSDQAEGFAEGFDRLMVSLEEVSKVSREVSRRLRLATLRPLAWQLVLTW
ncbi:MAG: hypothetical protein IH602_23870 [Bryobacteraceae bacterium]|nr:hypothetical protein [Bryobacteraceae bacterium]